MCSVDRAKRHDDVSVSVRALTRIALFIGAPANELDRLAPHMRVESLQAGETIVDEGQAASCTFILLDGAARLSRQGQTVGEEIVAGDTIGAARVFDEDPHHWTVRTLCKTTLAVIPHVQIRNLEAVARLPFLQQSVREGRRERAAEASWREHARKERAQLLAFALMMLVVLSVTLLSSDLLRQLFNVMPSSTFVLWIYLVILLLTGARFLHITIRPLSAYGLTFKGAGASIRESLIFTTLAVLLVTILKWVAVHTIPAYEGFPLIDIGNLSGSSELVDESRNLVIVLTCIGYMIGGFAQELAARGVLQGELVAAFDEEGTPWKAILFSSFVFSSVHAVWSLQLTILSFVAGVVWGWLYSRHVTIIGVGLSHAILGLWALKVLNLPALYHISPV